MPGKLRRRRKTALVVYSAVVTTGAVALTAILALHISIIPDNAARWRWTIAAGIVLGPLIVLGAASAFAIVLRWFAASQRRGPLS